MADPKPRGAPKIKQRLFSRTYVAMTVSLAAVMFLTGLAALAVVPTLPVATRALQGLPFTLWWPRASWRRTRSAATAAAGTGVDEHRVDPALGGVPAVVGSVSG